MQTTVDAHWVCEFSDPIRVLVLLCFLETCHSYDLFSLFFMVVPEPWRSRYCIDIPYVAENSMNIYSLHLVLFFSPHSWSLGTTDLLPATIMWSFQEFHSN